LVKRFETIFINYEEDVDAGTQKKYEISISPKELNLKSFKVLGWNVQRAEYADETTAGTAVAWHFVKNRSSDEALAVAATTWQSGKGYLGGGALVNTGGRAVLYNPNYNFPEAVPFDRDDVLYCSIRFINKGGAAKRFEILLTLYLEVED